MNNLLLALQGFAIGAALVFAARFVWLIIVNIIIYKLPMPDRGALTHLFGVYIPPDYRERLSVRELEAVRLHETGHVRHFHVWTNMLRYTFMIRETRYEYERKELQADDYAIDRGYGRPLGRAILKLGAKAPFDLMRAHRAISIGVMREEDARKKASR